MKLYSLIKKIFPFIQDNKEEVLPANDIRKLGLLYSIYRLVMSLFLFMSSYEVIYKKATLAIKTPLFLHQWVLLGYGLSSLLLLILLFSVRAKYDMQVTVGLVIDVVIITTLLYLSGAPNVQLIILYMVVVAVSFMLLASYQALIITMMSVICVIYQQFFYAVMSDISLVHLGEALLVSVSFICVAFLSWSISQRLIKMEKIATISAEQVIKLNNITQEVIGKMHQGVLVLDKKNHIMLSNHATSTMLNLDIKDMDDYLIADKEHLDENQNYHKNTKILAQKIIKQHPKLIKWRKNIPLNRPSKLIYQLPVPTSKIDKLRITSTPMQDNTILVLIEDLRREQIKAQQLKLASLGQLTASIAHEIRNPLAAISQASQLLLDDLTDLDEDPNSELYQMIFNQTKRVNRIIEDVLKLSKQAEPKQSKLDIGLWLEEFIANYYHNRDVSLDVKSTSFVYFDPYHLERILINLVDNGLRFSSKLHPHAFVKIEVFCQENDVILDVLDTGSGVDEDHQENLFMPFFTTDNEGTGLGLYLSQAFAEANFAQLLHIAEHEKTCFRLEMPQAIADNKNVHG